MPAWKLWIHGLVAAIISGAAGGIGNAVGSLALGDPIGRAAKLSALGALFSGVIGAAAYLKQSPVPPGWDGTDRRGNAAPKP